MCKSGTMAGMGSAITCAAITCANTERRSMLPGALLSAAIALVTLVNPVIAAGAERIDHVVAIVDDDVVLESELKEAEADIADALRDRGVSAPSAEALRTRAIEQLINESIQIQLGRRMNVRIDDNQLNERMTMVASQSGMSLDAFRARLEARGMSYAELREQVRKEMVMQQVRNRRVADRIFVSPKDVQDFLATDEGRQIGGGEYHLQQLLLPVPADATAEQQQAAESYMQGLRDELGKGLAFTTLMARENGKPVALAGQSVQFDDLDWRKSEELPRLFADAVREMKTGMTTLLHSPAGWHLLEIQEMRGNAAHLVRQTHVRHILLRSNEIRSPEEAQQELEQLRERIIAGADFAELAKVYSNDPGSARAGGDLGWVNGADMVGEFQKMLDTAREKTLSPVFSTQYGWHLLEVLERRDQDMSREYREMQARNTLFQRRFEEEVGNWLKEVRAAAYVDIKTN